MRLRAFGGFLAALPLVVMCNRPRNKSVVAAPNEGAKPPGAAAALPPAGGGPVAFPGAEGFGAIATGGRGGRVIAVTTLAASGPGSLQAALDADGPRTIVFHVSGVVAGVPVLQKGDVTIAGQTSPGGVILRGLMIQGDTVCEQEGCPLPGQSPSNFVVRHLRIRPAGSDDAVGSGDGLRLHRARRGIVDHLSIGNAADEAVQISLSSELSLQDSIIAETLGAHAELGGILINYSDPGRGFPLTRIALLRNLLVRIQGRTPELSRENFASSDGTTAELEIANNVIWDPHRPMWLAGANPQTKKPVHWRINFVGNVYGLAPQRAYGMLTIEETPKPQALAAGSSLFLSGNRSLRFPKRSDLELIYCCNDYDVADRDGSFPYGPARAAQFFAQVRHAFPAVSYLPAGEATISSVVETAGALPRDPMDRRLTAPVRARGFDASPSDRNPAGDALSLTFDPRSPPAPPPDADGDGIDDAWEKQHGLDSANPKDGNATTLSVSRLRTPGYTNLEVYLHELASSRSAR